MLKRENFNYVKIQLNIKKATVNFFQHQTFYSVLVSHKTFLFQVATRILLTKINLKRHISP